MKIDTAYRIRYERGCMLPISDKYEDPRVALIAIKQQSLMNELNELDEQLKRLYEESRKVNV